MEVQSEILNQLYCLKGQEVTLAKEGYGSFIQVGFGEDIDLVFQIKGKSEVKKRPQWLLWLQMCEWKLWHEENLILSSSDPDQNKIACLKGEMLKKIDVGKSKYHYFLKFSNFFVLEISYNDQEDEDQWLLFTPNKQVWALGANDTFESESEV